MSRFFVRYIILAAGILGSLHTYAANKFTIEPFNIEMTIEHGNIRVARPEMIVYCSKTEGWYEPSQTLSSTQVNIQYDIKVISPGMSRLVIMNEKEQKFQNPYGTFGRKECHVTLSVVVEDPQFLDPRRNSFVGSLPRPYLFSRMFYSFNADRELMGEISKLHGTQLQAHYLRDSVLDAERGEFFWCLLLWNAGTSRPDINAYPYYLIQSKYLIGDLNRPLRVGLY